MTSETSGCKDVGEFIRHQTRNKSIACSVLFDSNSSSSFGNKHCHNNISNQWILSQSKNIGIIFQQYYFVSSLSVEDNLLLRQSFPVSSIDNERRNKITERLGLKEHLNKKVNALSQGQQQRLSIALGLINKPKLILADEPTSNLDDANCDTVIELLKEEAAICGSSLVVITHDHRVKSHFEKQLSL